MVLLQTAQGAITQRFGVSHIEDEPEMWYATEKAYWLPVAGMALNHSDNFHPGLDIANEQGVVGDPIRAQEAGRVVFAAWRDSISGIQIEVQVNETFRYSTNHLLRLNKHVGDNVRKGDVIAFMGQTGLATGPHAHVGNSFYERGADGVFRTWLYDPELFTAGGKYANDRRIQPEQRYVALAGLGVNLLLFPPHGYIGRPYARSMDPPGAKRPGIYRLGTGNRLGPVNKRFPFLYWHVSQAKGRVAVVHGFGQRLAIRDEHVHFTD